MSLNLVTNVIKSMLAAYYLVNVTRRTNLTRDPRLEVADTFKETDMPSVS